MSLANAEGRHCRHWVKKFTVHRAHDLEKNSGKGNYKHHTVEGQIFKMRKAMDAQNDRGCVPSGDS